MKSIRYMVMTCIAVALGMLVDRGPVAAQDAARVLATVNGKGITENDLRFAEAEIGQDLGSLAPDVRRRVLVEYLIENQLFAEAGMQAGLGQGPSFDQRMEYWRRRALREAYFETKIRDAVNDQDAKAFFDKQVAGMKPEEEVRARHILVDKEEEAKDIVERLNRGDDFAVLAKEKSKDPGSGQNGGDLGYFGRGQMVPEFEKTAYALKKGEISSPVKTQFGWHVLKLEDRRSKPVPTFEQVKDRLLAALVHRKAQEIAKSLRTSAKVEYIDPELKAMNESPGGAAPKQ